MDASSPVRCCAAAATAATLPRALASPADSRLSPSAEADAHSPETTLSWVLGWSYFACWSLSFYAQPLLNHRRRSARGLSLDFLALNLLGFACLSAYVLGLYAVPRVRRDEAARNGGHDPQLVKLNDVAFALHALVLTALTWAQARWYGDATPVSPKVRVGIYAACLLLGFAVVETAARDATWDASAPFWRRNAWTWLGFLQTVSFVKLVVTMIKYTPQLLLNWSRRSTEGWSVHNVLLDLAGGVLSLAQLFVDAHQAGDLSSALLNPVKLGLALLSIAYDALFLLQHFVWFAQPPSLPVSPLPASRTGSRTALLLGGGAGAQSPPPTVVPLAGAATGAADSVAAQARSRFRGAPGPSGVADATEIVGAEVADESATLSSV